MPSPRDLLPQVYDELRRLAAAKLAHEKPGHSLDATALVHEAWLRLAEASVEWQDRNHFFRVAATAMRRILVDQRGPGGRRSEAVAPCGLTGSRSPCRCPTPSSPP